VSDRNKEAREIASQPMLDAVLQSVGEAIVTINESSKIVMVNLTAESMWGYSHDELIGADLSLLMPERMRRAHAHGLQHYLETGNEKLLNKRVSLIAQHSGGKEFPIELYIAPTVVAGRTYFTGAVRDISDRTAAESKLRTALDCAEAASRAKSAFVATMSHEIRTPLNAITGAITLLKDSPLTQSQSELLALAQDSAQSLLDTLNTILDFSKIEAGRVEIESLSFDIYQLIASVVNLVEPRAMIRNLEIFPMIDPRVPRVLVGDPGLIRQVLLNLLSNAIKFTERGAISISVEAHAHSDADPMRINFAIEDTGVGISPDSIPELFTEFSQADHSYTRRHGGSGLGLAIVKRLLTALDGEIEVRSEPSIGSRFSFDVPVKADLEASTQHLNVNSTSGRVIAIFLPVLLARSTLRIQLERWQFVPLCPEHNLGHFLTHVSDDTSAPPPELIIIRAEDYSKFTSIVDSATWTKFIVLVSPLDPSKDVQTVPSHVYQLATPIRTIRLYRLIMDLLSESNFLEQNPEADYENDAQDLPFAPPGARILLAEDSPSNQYVGKEILMRAGYSVDVANDGVEAVELARLFPYDAILMDQHMPEMDGLCATKAIRNLPPESAQVPIIAMTANVSDSNQQECLAAGMNNFVGKPFDRTVLLRMLADYAEKSAPLRLIRDEVAPGEVIDKTIWIKLRSNLGDASLRTGVNLFLRELGQRTEEITDASKNSDYPKIALLAHALSSGAKTFGALRLGELLEELQDAAEAGRILDIQQNINSLIPEMAASRSELEALV
jgi:two-component system sensor histidine kinase/response regulator